MGQIFNKKCQKFTKKIWCLGDKNGQNYVIDLYQIKTYYGPIFKDINNSEIDKITKKF